jgi:hypothetical protein
MNRVTAGLAGVPEADVGAGLLVFVPGQAEGGRVLEEAIAGPAHGEENFTQAVACLCFAGSLAHFAEHGQRVLEMIGGLLVMALLQCEVTESGQR